MVAAATTVAAVGALLLPQARPAVDRPPVAVTGSADGGPEAPGGTEPAASDAAPNDNPTGDSALPGPADRNPEATDPNPADAAPSDAAPSDTAAADGARAGAVEGRGAALAVRDVAGLGPVLVDARGFTLYRFDGDAPGRATCTGACARTWPPATVEAAARLSVDGLTSTDVGLIRHGDGEVQLTVGGWPVYRFAGDDRPGQADGHGVGRAWHAVTSSGGKATSS